MAMSELKRKLLIYELAKIGFRDAQYHPISDRVQVQPDNDRMPKISDIGDINYGTEYNSLAINTLRPLVDRVNEAVAAWERSRTMPFEDLSEFRVLAEYNNIMMAARDDTVYGRGLHFVTWQYNYNRTGLDHGHYTENYNAVKEDFAERSGLIPSVKLFTQEQAAEIKAAIDYRINYDGDITYSTEDALKSIAARLNAAYPEKDANNNEEQAVETQAEAVMTASAIYGELCPGDWVISADNNDYSYLIGTVTAIDKLGTPEHVTGNLTDDVHINFNAFDYPQERITEIEEHFSALYGERKHFVELSLDDVIMAPKMLISISNLSHDEITRMGNIRHNCEAFCNCFPSSNIQIELIERLDANLAEYHDSLMGFGKEELIDMAAKISAMTDMHSYLTTTYGFDDGAAEYLLNFQNPLEVVADEWEHYQSDTSDMSFVVDEVVYKQDALQGDYALISDAPTQQTDLRRYMGVDLIDFLGKIAEKTIIHHPNDWNIDKNELDKAAASLNPEDKRLMWHVCSVGTHIKQERDVFIKDSGAYNYWTDYHQDDPDMFGYAVEVTGRDGLNVMGNVFEVGNYAEHAKYVRETALPLANVTLTYSDGWGVNAGKRITVSRGEYDSDRNRLMSKSGNVTALRWHPANESELIEVLQREQRSRMALSIGSMEAHVQRLTEKLSEIRNPSELPSRKPKQTLEERLHAAGERAKAQSPQNNGTKSHKRDERS